MHTPSDPVADTLKDFIFLDKYARQRPDGQRETWDDAVDRVRDMHRRRYPQLDTEIVDAFELVRQRRVMPSMRSMQFGGLAQDVNHARGYNCAATAIDRVAAFAEYFYLLLCGCGVGISVQREHIAKLPPVARPLGFERFVVEDTIEGWADAAQALMRAYLGNGARPEFDYSQIRPEGAPIVTGGGLAPGPEPLRRALNEVRTLLEFRLDPYAPARGSLRPIDAYDICMHLSGAVMAGGVRRSATAVLFSPDDVDMRNAKIGVWYRDNSQRARSNNSAVLDRTYGYPGQFEAIFRAAREWGEPGFYFTDEPLTHLTNPCVTGDTWVHTLDGPQTIRDIARRDRFDALLDGVPHRSIGLGSRGVKPVFRVRTRKGFEIRATAEHKVMTQRGWVPVDHLRLNKDKIRLSANRNGTVRWSGNGTWDEGWLLGHLYGNGTFSDDVTARLDFWGEDRWYMLGFAKACLDGAFGPSSRRKGSTPQSWSDENADKVSIHSRDLAQLAADYGMSRGSKAPLEGIERTSYDFHCGFLSGWFDADGTVAERVAAGKGIDVRLSCTDNEMLSRAQRMLARLGIIARRYENRQPAGARPLPDGKGGTSLYECKAGHELVIGKDNAIWFAERVGFQREHKKQRLGTEIAAYTGRGPYSEKFYDRVIAVEPDGAEEVFDVQVDDVHAFDANGMYISNCYEIGLHPFTDDGRSGVAFCNLTTINGALCRNQREFYEACAAASLIGTLQAGYTNFPYLSAESREIAERDALLGVSICGFLDHPQLLLDSDVLRMGAAFVCNTNEYAACAIGINPAARLTCVKPDGTVSLALGLDVAGIHPAHARRYLRRIRCAANNPVFETFRAANPHAVERDTMDPTGKTWIAVFPVDVDDDAVLRTDIDAETFLRNVVTVQRNWVDPGTVRGTHRHAVSNTCTVRDDEWDDVERIIWDNRNEIAAVSLLSEVGDKVYPQAPREAVTTPQDYEVWEHLREHWRTPDWSGIAGSAAIEPAQACAGGMCEL